MDEKGKQRNEETIQNPDFMLDDGDSSGGHDDRLFQEGRGEAGTGSEPADRI